MNTLEDLFLDALADLYYSEKQLVEKALPEMAGAAADDELRAAFAAHLAETIGHVGKCEQVFKLFGKRPEAKRCPAMLGIIEEAEEIIVENRNKPTINAALILAAQKAEHYEIASYGTLREWARYLQRPDAAKMVDEILADEKAADAQLTKLAQSHCNYAARIGDEIRKAA
jgi:ferritin-like metal-binding protein YciE